MANGRRGMCNHSSFITRLLPLVLCGLFLLFSCNRANQEEPTPYASDTSSIRVALLPTLDCLPLAIAADEGLFDRLGLEVRLIMFHSQMEAEKALTLGHVDVCASDAWRLADLRNKGTAVEPLFATRREWALVATKSLRTQKLQDVSSRMIAGTRLSAVDFLADSIETRLSQTNGPMLRPQINDLRIRQRMLTNAQVDAALLPVPIAMQAVQAGGKKLFESGEATRNRTGFIVKSQLLEDSIQSNRLNILRQAYDSTAVRLSRLPRLPQAPTLDALFHLNGQHGAIEPGKHFAPSTEMQTL